MVCRIIRTTEIIMGSSTRTGNTPVILDIFRNPVMTNPISFQTKGNLEDVGEREDRPSVDVRPQNVQGL